MTHNQIDYWSLQESKQHNRATEREQALSRRSSDRHYRRQDAISSRSQQEAERANRAKENIDIGNLQEKVRSNLASEALKNVDLNISQQRADEQKRSNQQNELLKQLEVQEKKVANDIAKAKAETEATLADSTVFKDQYVAKYYKEQANKIQEDIDRLWAEYETNKDIDYLTLIEKYVKDLINLPSAVKGAKG